MQNRKQLRKQFSKRQQRGGAIYTFDLTDKIGGLPARIPLNGTRDGDCPASETKDLGFVNYGMTRGGARRRRSTKGKRRSGKGKSKRHTKKH